jgi:DcuC family C4-dicarboxylate transporter
MAFSYVLRHTGCDQHLVHLLVRPLSRVRPLLVPGTVVVGFLVNMPVVSQTSTAATIGPVVIPVLRAAGLSPLTTGATLLLGCSIGGELLNPGAPELRTTIAESRKAAMRVPELAPDPERYDSNHCIERMLPLDLVALLVGTLVFWGLSYRSETAAAEAVGPADGSPALAEFRVNPLKAMVPLLPLALLYLTTPVAGGEPLVHVPQAWIEEPTADGRRTDAFDTRLIGAAMLLGSAVAALAAPRKTATSAAAFFEGAGYGFTHIISLIVVANCFGQAIREIGLAAIVGEFVGAQPDWLLPAAGALPLAFAARCGSGMAATQSLFGFFAEPALRLGIDPTHVGAVVSIASAAGRTMSPVAAVTLITAQLTGTHPLQLARRVAVPLLVSTAAVIAAAIALAPPP